jgi:hypothetical protein
MPIFIDRSKDTLYDKGLKRGFKKGYKRGIEIGIEIGIQLEKTYVVIRCYENNYSLKDISIITGISLYRIKAIIGNSPAFFERHKY